MEPIAVEKAFLGCVVADPSLLDRTELESDDFGGAVTRMVFDAMMVLRDRGEPANDWLCLQNELDLEAIGGAAVITSWTFDTDHGAINLTNGPNYAKVIVEQSDRRRLAAGLTAAATRGLSGKLALDEAVAVVEKAVSRRRRGKPDDVMTVASRVWDRATEYSQNPLEPGQVRGIDTGWVDLNRIMGGWCAGLYIIMAVEHMGKSWFALHTAAQACAAGKRAMFFPLEMRADDLVTRLCTAHAQVILNDYKAGRMNSDQFQQFAARASEITEWNLEINDTASSLATVMTAIRRAHRRETVDMVVVDPLSLLADSKGENRNLQLGTLTRELKLLSREIGAPFLVPHHASSKAIAQRTNKRPQLSDPYESGHIGQDADVVISLYREGFYDPECENPNVLEVKLVKDRLGGQAGQWLQLACDTYGNMRSMDWRHDDQEPPPEDAYSWRGGD